MGDDPHDQPKYTIPRKCKSPTWRVMTCGACAASIVTLPPNSNGSGPRDQAPAQPEDTPTAQRDPDNQNTIPTWASLPAVPPVAWTWSDGVEIPATLGVTLLYGPTGSGKSFVALDYAFQIAQTGPVVYVAAEGAAGYAARVLAWRKHHGQGRGAALLCRTAPSTYLTRTKLTPS